MDPVGHNLELSESVLLKHHQRKTAPGLCWKGLYKVLLTMNAGAKPEVIEPWALMFQDKQGSFWYLILLSHWPPKIKLNWEKDGDFMWLTVSAQDIRSRLHNLTIIKFVFLSLHYSDVVLEMQHHHLYFSGHLKGRGWDDLGEWHWNIYNIIYETSRQSRFKAWYWMLGAGALRRPWMMVRGGRREGFSGWGTRVYLWWIHVDVWPNQYNIVR